MPLAAQNRRALLVGVGRYLDAVEFPPLRAPTRDVEAFGQLLASPDRCAFTDVVKLRNPDAREIQSSTERLLATATAGDLVLFYFSGHGKLSADGGLHLCASDTEADLLLTTTLPASLLSQFINRTRAAQVVIVLDCCYSGAADFTMKGDVSSILTTHLGQGRGKYLISSSSAIQPSLESLGGEHSVFTKWLVHGLETGEADGTVEGSAESVRDGVITIEELFLYSQKKTIEEVATQRPQRKMFSDDPGDIIIAQTAQARASGAMAPPQPNNPRFFKAVELALGDGECIPFLGSGVYGSGPLSSFALRVALAERAGTPVESADDLSAAAEYLVRHYDNRARFLTVFRRVIEQQSAQVESRSTHDLVSDMKPPFLIISATHDWVLERRLEREGKPFVVVSHVVRSSGGQHDGKILVVRWDGEWSSEVCLADAVEFDEATDRVIYKVLGSPFLMDYADSRAAVDTVVVTETDHLVFLGRLEHEKTRVPTAFTLPFRQRQLLFLGYSLDLWHYRLVLQVFGNRPDNPPYAVRQPTTPIEELCWRRLNADLIRLDPEQFARTLTAKLVGV